MSKTLLCLCAVLFACCLAAIPCFAQEEPKPKADQQTVDRLVEQMATGSYRQRQAAYKALDAMGPDAVAYLLKHRDHRNAEVRKRLRKIIDVHSWMRWGSLIWKIKPDSKAEKLGLKVGDVLLKINQEDNKYGLDVLKIENRTFTLMRDGKIIEMKVPDGKLGYYSGPWYSEKGGLSLIEAIRAYDKEDYGKSARWFRQAIQEQLPPRFWVYIIAGTFEFEMDHQEAMKYFRLYMEDIDYDNHYYKEAPWSFYHAPWYPAMTACLLERYEQWKQSDEDLFDTIILRQLCPWSVYGTHNLPLARELYAIDWPDDLHDRAKKDLGVLKIYLGYYEGRDQEVLRTAREIPTPTCKHHYRIAFRSAIRAGDVDYMISRYTETLSHFSTEHSSMHYSLAQVGPCAIAMAYLNGRRQGGHELLEMTLGMPANMREEILTSQTYRLLGHARVVDHVLPHLETYLAGNGEDRKMREVYLNLLAGSETLTREQWDQAIEQHGLDPKRQRNECKDLNRLAVNVMLRFGDIDQAEKLLSGKAGPMSRFQKSPAQDVIKFLREEETQKRLQSDWKELRGSVMLFTDKAHKCRWLLRWDGRVLRLKDDGSVDEPPGIDRHMGFRPAFKEGMHTKAGLTRLNRRFQHYMFDEDSDRWVKTWLLQGQEHCRKVHLGGGGEVSFLRDYVKNGNPGPGKPIRGWYQVKPYIVFQIRNEMALYRFGSKEHIQLNQTIAEKLGRKGGVEISSIYSLPECKDVTAYLTTNVGLWIISPQGELSRVDLGLENPDQWVFLTRYPRREGKIHLGLLPQNGGTIFEVDPKTFYIKRTGGYCGHGPIDGYSWTFLWEGKYIRVSEGSIVERHGQAQ